MTTEAPGANPPSAEDPQDDAQKKLQRELQKARDLAKEAMQANLKLGTIEMELTENKNAMRSLAEAFKNGADPEAIDAIVRDSETKSKRFVRDQELTSEMMELLTEHGTDWSDDRLDGKVRELWDKGDKERAIIAAAKLFPASNEISEEAINERVLSVLRQRGLVVDQNIASTGGSTAPPTREEMRNLGAQATRDPKSAKAAAREALDRLFPPR